MKAIIRKAELRMERIFEWAKKSGSIEKIELNVRPSNAQAIALYKKKWASCLKHDWVAIRTLKTDAIAPFIWPIIQASSP